MSPLSHADDAILVLLQNNTIRVTIRVISARPRHLLLASSGCRALEWIVESGGACVVREMLGERALAVCTELLRLQSDARLVRAVSRLVAKMARESGLAPKSARAGVGASRSVRQSLSPGGLGNSMEFSGPLGRDAAKLAAEEMRAALRESGLLRVVKETLHKQRANETVVMEEMQMVATLCDDSE